jgi:hypothetical protein
MDLINDIDLETAFVGGEVDSISQVTDIIHTCVGGRVDLN